MSTALFYYFPDLYVAYNSLSERKSNEKANIYEEDYWILFIIILSMIIEEQI